MATSGESVYWGSRHVAVIQDAGGGAGVERMVLVRAQGDWERDVRGLCCLGCFRGRPGLGCSCWPGNLFPTTEAAEPHHPL